MVEIAAQKLLNYFILAIVFPYWAGEAQDLPPVPRLTEQQLEEFDRDTRQRIQAAYARVLANPVDPEANGQLGRILQASEQQVLASTLYQRARLLRPGRFEWAYYSAVTLNALGRVNEAIAALRETTRLNPDYLPAQLKLAELLLNRGNWEESNTICKQVVRQHPDCGLAHYGIGQAEFSRGNLSDAVKSYLSASQLLPDFGAAHYALAMAYRDLGEKEKSREHLRLFQRSTGNTPSLPDPLLESINGLKPRAENFFKKGLSFQRSGRLQDAILEYKRAIEADPQLAGAHANLLFVYLVLGQLGKAEKHYYSAVKLDPNIYEIHHNLGILRKVQGRNQEAVEAFRKTLKINPFYADSHHMLATILAEEERWDEAEQHSRLALENKPNFWDAHFQLGWTLQRQGKHSQAISHFLKARSVEGSKTSAVMYALAQSYAHLGNTTTATHYARRAKQQADSYQDTALSLRIERFLRHLKQRQDPQ